MRTQRSRKRQPSRAKKSRTLLHATKKVKRHVRVIPTYTTQSIGRRIEALLLAPTPSIRPAELALMLHADDKTVHSALRQLQTAYARRNSPFMLVDDADGWRFAMTMHAPAYQNNTSGQPAADDEISTPEQELLIARHAQPTQALQMVIYDEQPSEYGEFLEELNEKIAAIAHHNKNTTKDEHLRERLLSEIEGLMHTVPGTTETRQ